MLERALTDREFLDKFNKDAEEAAAVQLAPDRMIKNWNSSERRYQIYLRGCAEKLKIEYKYRTFEKKGRHIDSRK